MMLTAGTTVINASQILGDAMNSAASDMGTAISTAAPLALGIGAAVLVITMGWKLFKRFTK